MPSERLHGKKPTQEFVPFGEKVLAKQDSTDRTYDFGICFGMPDKNAEYFIGNADGVFRARDVARQEPSEQMGQRNRQQRDWCALENE